jgi:arylsulfatase A-like enzyme
VTAAGLLPNCGPTHKHKGPNVLFVLSDAHRAATVGCYGDDDARTPHMDALAAEGLRLTTAISNTPVCRPYRASLMTGALGHHCGLVGNWSEHNARDTVSESYEPGTLPRGHQWTPGDLPTLGATFKDAGYRCGYVGKWHLGQVDIDPGPLRFGFDDHWAVSSEPAHDYWDSHYFTGSGPSIDKKGVFKPTLTTDLARQFIREDDDRPWLLFLSWAGPHKPFEAPASYQHFDHVRPLANSAKGTKSDLPGYHAMIEALDHELGRLLAMLKKRGLDDNTIVIYTSDHGSQLGSHGWGGKELPYDGSTRVPFIVRWPGHIAADTTLAAPLSTPDILPTLASLAGLPTITVPDGIDLSAQLLGAADERAAPAAYIACYVTPAAKSKPTWRGLRTEQHLFACTEDGPWILYDILKDPLELLNLVDSEDSGAKALVADFYARTLEAMQAKGDVWFA